MTKKIEDLGLHKPKRYASGHDISIGYLDIETTGFSANIDLMLSWCIKGRGVKKVEGAWITKEELMSEKQDARIVELLVEEMNKYDIIFTYYGTRFDILLLEQEHCITEHTFQCIKQNHKNLYYAVKNKLKLHRSSLMAAKVVLWYCW